MQCLTRVRLEPNHQLNRPYCQMEIRHALALKKPVVLLHGEIETIALITHAQYDS